VFDKKIIKHPAEIIIHVCTFMSHWAGLFHTDFTGGIVEGVKVMLALAHKILAQQKRGASVKLLPAPGDDQKNNEVA
jgi:Asp/Glu/hydantoin racemase